MGLSVRPSVRPTIRPSVRPFVFPSIRRSVRSSVRPFVGPSVCWLVCPSVRPSVGLSVFLSVGSSICRSVRYAFSFSAISTCFLAPRGQYWLVFPLLSFFVNQHEEHHSTWFRKPLPGDIKIQLSHKLGSERVGEQVTRAARSERVICAYEHVSRRASEIVLPSWFTEVLNHSELQWITAFPPFYFFQSALIKSKRRQKRIYKQYCLLFEAFQTKIFGGSRKTASTFECSSKTPQTYSDNANRTIIAHHRASFVPISKIDREI